MLRTSTLIAFLLLVVFTGMMLVGSGTAVAQTTSDVFWVGYYSGGATNSRTPPATVGSLYSINPGASGGTLCADVYVFDQFEEMQECCSCPITIDGLFTDTIFDLTNNPSFTNKFSATGVIKVISDVACSAAAPVPTPELRSYITNPQSTTVTESELEPTPLSGAEQAQLAQACSFIKTNQSGRGICGQAAGCFLF
ncbi:MAG TPA: hypothetical protein VFA89_08910 [Terriglobales bacterium]|jgi:hypothetical protein|nr:hypothetical protein [Terriglobales bacterium]